MQNRPTAGYLEWEKVKEFEESGVVLSVMMLKIENPRYSYEIGVRTQPQKVGRRFPLTLSGQGKTLAIKRTDLEVQARLIRAAEDWVLSEAQKTEAQNAPPAPKHDPRSNQPPRRKGPPLGIKELGKLDKAKREAAAEAAAQAASAEALKQE